MTASFAWTRLSLSSPFDHVDDNYRSDRFCPASAAPRFPPVPVDPLSDVKRTIWNVTLYPLLLPRARSPGKTRSW